MTAVLMRRWPKQMWKYWCSTRVCRQALMNSSACRSNPAIPGPSWPFAKLMSNLCAAARTEASVRPRQHRAHAGKPSGVGRWRSSQRAGPGTPSVSGWEAQPTQGCRGEPGAPHTDRSGSAGKSDPAGSTGRREGKEQEGVALKRHREAEMEGGKPFLFQLAKAFRQSDTPLKES